MRTSICSVYPLITLYFKSISQLFDMIGSRLVTEMDDSQRWVFDISTIIPLAYKCASSAMDTLQTELMSELENARLVRLMCKLGFINERPEYVS